MTSGNLKYPTASSCIEQISLTVLRWHIFILWGSGCCWLTICGRIISTSAILQPFRSIGNAVQTRWQSGRACNRFRDWAFRVARQKFWNLATLLIPTRQSGFVFRSKNKRSRCLEPGQGYSGESRKIFGSSLKKN